eukprot:CAMPEP_0175613554 /NCGR_PEP_ID=MMETSP0096-20121207/64400_1 /TAXON_ID=311494 /ORGANISM="Alexandrium monilatum, Strain CCMP3105" /LENGTH=166 /DNA_ID=CAMNT_0016918637 /DNA_START=1 /DNA_END=502 /DNA_ORIENTATION=-
MTSGSSTACFSNTEHAGALTLQSAGIFQTLGGQQKDRRPPNRRVEDLQDPVRPVQAQRQPERGAARVRIHQEVKCPLHEVVSHRSAVWAAGASVELDLHATQVGRAALARREAQRVQGVVGLKGPDVHVPRHGGLAGAAAHCKANRRPGVHVLGLLQRLHGDLRAN